MCLQESEEASRIKKFEYRQSHLYSWRHTFGTRLRNQALCSEEERKDIMGHKSVRSMIEHYLVPELDRMLEYCEKISKPPERQMVLVKRNKLAV